VLLFSPMPVFPDFDRQLQLLAPKDLTGLRPDTSQIRMFDAAMAEVDLKGVGLIDTARLFCGDPLTCAPYDSASKLTDYSHLSVHGAAGFGQALVTLPGLPFPSP
jgi:hypothetical protein